ncbi:MAG: aldo/keto reductase [Massilibacteroides sp.]|nr:aldo/keto reductase [Massilibacteroides sp.]MDD3063359.1 aldo/keto reductase [Massilibacteroides sp.]MDD4114220.1 aldo/keto reductase [Massilibacteroides sp.]MDD4661171.1 aldo/keto reductase [Massilibacteroides sp.]
MAPLNRRQFIKSGIAGITGAALSGQITFANSALPPENHKIPQVSLGQTGIKISQIGLGTGSVAYNKSSNQTRLGMEQFVKLARHAYERGLCYFDLADSYGSHTYMANALKHMSREKVELCSKIWTYPNGSDKIVPVEQSLDRFRKEIGTDYIDILLMHCLMEPGWTQSRSYYIDALSKAKQDGIVKAVGVSCHNWEAMVEAVDSPWVDVILARINPFQSNMDGTPDAVNKLLGKAVKNGKGVIGMKIFGEGKNVSVEERERSLHFAIHEANIHCMTIGLESIAQIDDLVERVSKTL